MKIIHHNGFSDNELAEYRPIVYNDVLSSAQAIIVYMCITGMECEEFGNRALAEKILDYKLDAAPGASAAKPYFSPDIAEAIHELWKDKVVAKIMDEHSSDFYLMDSAA